MRDIADMNPSDDLSCNIGKVFYLTFINAWRIEHIIERVESRK